MACLCEGVPNCRCLRRTVEPVRPCIAIRLSRRLAEVVCLAALRPARLGMPVRLQMRLNSRPKYLRFALFRIRLFRRICLSSRFRRGIDLGSSIDEPVGLGRRRARHRKRSRGPDGTGRKHPGCRDSSSRNSRSEDFTVCLCIAEWVGRRSSVNRTKVCFIVFVMRLTYVYVGLGDA